MSPEQFERWLDFSRRMARSCHRRNGRVRQHVEDFIGRYRERPSTVNGWDGEGRYAADGIHPEVVFLCDEMSDYLWDQGLERDRKRGVGVHRTTTGCAIAACVRSGLDLAVTPSGGVIGYTAGDLRSMYPEGFPPWLAEALGPEILAAKDTAELWL